MDPATAAGIGLGVTSLTFQLFSGCIKGYQLLLDAANMPQQFQHLQLRLRLEQTRLLMWGNEVGLLQEVLEEPSLVLQLHRNLIFDVLLQISQLFTACMKVERKFRTSGVVNSGDLGRMALEGGVTPFEQSTQVLLAKATRLLSRTAELPKRLEWAMIKQDKFEKLVEQLISYNNSMMSLLDSANLHQIIQTQRESGLTMLQLSTDVNTLKQLVQAVRLQPADSSFGLVRGHHLASHISPFLLENEHAGLAKLATFKANYLNNERHVDDLTIDMKDVHIVDSTARINLATFRGSTVWIDWKEFDQQNQNPWYKDILEGRAQKLATLLHMPDPPAEFRKPDCIGYVHEIEDDVLRYGFINKVPAQANMSIPPSSLLDLIKNEDSPSLSLRIKLASKLASSLMYLHSVNWLHKGF